MKGTKPKRVFIRATKKYMRDQAANEEVLTDSPSFDLFRRSFITVTTAFSLGNAAAKPALKKDRALVTQI